MQIEKRCRRERGRYCAPRFLKSDTFQSEGCGGGFAAGISPSPVERTCLSGAYALSSFADRAWFHHILPARYFIFSDLVRASSPAAITSSVVISEMGV